MKRFLVVLAACSSPAPVPAPAPRSAVAPSPLDRGSLYFNALVDKDYEIYRVPANGGEAVNVSRSTGVDWIYDARPSEEKSSTIAHTLYAVSSREGRFKRPQYDLYRIDREGKPTRITDAFPVHDSYLGVAPERDRIVVCSRKDGDSELYLIDHGGVELAKLTDNSFGDCDPDWSVANRIVFRSNRSGAWEIWSIAIDGTDPKQLTDLATNDATDSGYGGDGPPRWSPDGKQIAWWSKRDGDFDLWVMDAEGGNARRVLDTPGDESWLAWSPDGTQLAFGSDLHEVGKNSSLYVVGIDGTGLRRLTTHATRTDYGPVWLPSDDSWRSHCLTDKSQITKTPLPGCIGSRQP
jgi:Tol biopolymer transport system component